MSLFPVYLFVFIVSINRYILGLYLKLTRGQKFDRTIQGFEPTVTIVVPLFNEGKSIYDTIMAFDRLDYPKSKLAVTIVDDCSTDDSFEWAKRAAAKLGYVTVLKNPHNMGKRKGINEAVRRATSEMIVSVDSDVFVDPQALRALFARFTAPDIAAVGGRIHVSNANDNWLSRMQTIKYFFGQEYLKNLERSLESVMCLSGCLTAYRRHVLIELEPILENRNILGVPIKYGEDRFLTRQIVKAGYRTLMTTDAVCFTKAPTQLGPYFNQQLRWKRSNIVDFMGGLTHAWKLHPLLGVHYASMFVLLLVYPFLIWYHLQAGQFGFLVSFHMCIVGVFGVIYYFSPTTRSLPEAQRVHPIWFLPMAVMMPAAYLTLTALGLFTLDTSSWETRGHSTPGPTGRPFGPLAGQSPSSLPVAKGGAP
jgi:cellulose synthase/poly-beta-1,6-N-acetylglucosamine synthase-like glycosyltransferase